MPISGLAKWLDMWRPPEATSVALDMPFRRISSAVRPGGDAGREVAVVGEEVVAAGTERHARARAGSRRARRTARGSSSRGPASGSSGPCRRGPGPGASGAYHFFSSSRETSGGVPTRVELCVSCGVNAPPFEHRTLILTSRRFPSFSSGAPDSTMAREMPHAFEPTLAAPADREEALRREMVARFVAPRGVDDPRVLEAMRRVPRHLLRSGAAAVQGLRRSLAADRPRADDLAALRRRPDDAAAGGRGRPQGPRDRQRARAIRPRSWRVSRARSIRSSGSTSSPARRRRRCARSAATTSRSRRSTGRTGYPAAAPYDRILVTAGTRRGAGAAARRSSRSAAGSSFRSVRRSGSACA